MMDANKALTVAMDAAKIGRKILLEYFGHLSEVVEKNQAGLVSEADKASEKAITEHILKFFPDTSIWGEEDIYNSPGKSPEPKSRNNGLWMIDPLDGTTNYVHNFPIYCISIGLEYEGELLVAVCDVPSLDRTYSAIQGQGAYLNGKRIHVSRTTELKNSLLATGFSTHETEENSFSQQIDIFSSVVREVRGIRRAGSAAFDLCLVAEGVFDCYWENGLSAWDTAAGALLVKEAGGVVSTYKNEKYDPFKSSIVAGNSFIHREVIKKIGVVIP